MTHNELVATRETLTKCLSAIDKMLKSEMLWTRKKRVIPDGRMEDVIRVVCDYAGITQRQLFDEGNKQNVVTWRKILSYILSDYSHVSLKEIALRLNYANHGTIIHHRDRMREWMSDPRFAPKDIHIATQNILHKLEYEQKQFTVSRPHLRETTA